MTILETICVVVATIWLGPMLLALIVYVGVTLMEAIAWLPRHIWRGFKAITEGPEVREENDDE
jgi:hypothetical protein